MKLGVNSVLFGGHDIATAFQYTAVSGYDGIEIGALAGMTEHLLFEHLPDHAAAIRRLSKEYNLPVLAMETSAQTPDKMEVAFQAAVETECPIINCGPGGQSNDEASFQQSMDLLGQLADLAERYGITLCVKAHVGASVYNTPTSLRMLQAITSKSFGLDMDPSHIHRAKETPVEAIAAVMDRIKHVHIRDCKGRQQNPGVPEMQANGRGDIDLLGYVRTLHQHGYTGPLDLEIIGAKEYELPRCVAIAAESRGHMQACLQACGAR